MNRAYINIILFIFLLYSSILEDAGNLISKRSLHWDLSNYYPGLVMRIGPTLANGVLEFVMDPRIKDRSSYQHPAEVSIGTLCPS